MPIVTEILCLFPVPANNFTRLFILHRPQSTPLFRAAVGKTDNKFNLIELQPKIAWINDYNPLFSAEFQSTNPGPNSKYDNY
jgi:hypothetical protein